MKAKKSKKANLENFRTIFFQIGIVITLSAILLAFEWKSAVVIEPVVLAGTSIDVIEIEMPRTKQKEKKQKIKPVVPFEQIIIKKNIFSDMVQIYSQKKQKIEDLHHTIKHILVFLIN